MMSFLFKNREHAAEELSDVIVKEYGMLQTPDIEAHKSVIVVAIPRGAVIIGDIIASKLGCPLDVVISRKIRSPFNEEFGVGAVMPDGQYFVNDGYIELFNISIEYLEKEIDFQKNEINRRLLEFRGKTSYDGIFDQKIVILVDDGIATGATIIASAQWIRSNFRCKALVVAVPVAPKSNKTISNLEKIVDNLIILHQDKNFSAVGQFYDRFEQVSDQTVKEIMRKYIKNNDSP